MLANIEDNELIIDPTEATDEDSEEYSRYEIAYHPADFTVRVLYDKWKSKQLVIPDFQRGYVWSLPQASRFVESFLLGLPIPQVFLYKPRSSPKLLVVDGHQRLATIAKFYDGQFTKDRKFRLNGVARQWNGKSYEDLSEDDRYHLDDSTLRSTIIQQLQPDDNTSIYQIFERLNTAGTQLNAMEIRKAILSGNGYDTLEKINADSNWRLLIGKQEPDKRLKDIELVLRVLALAHRQDEYSEPMKRFLTQYMEILSKESQDDLNSVEMRFKSACHTIRQQLGNKPFHLRGPLNLAALDSVVSTAINSHESLKDNFESDFDALKKNDAFITSTTTDTSKTGVLKARFELVRSFLLK